MTGPVLLIPAYKPPPALVELIREIQADPVFQAVVVVNDGSPAAFDATFDAIGRLPGVTVLRHAVNLGKGAALKMGLNHIYCAFPGTVGAVTADADGQHLPKDVQAVGRELAAHPETLVMGVRRFSEDVPWRSRFGNKLTVSIFHVLVGLRISDTQTGLRGIPLAFFERLLRLRASGYEFELDMLLEARKSLLPLRECPIATVYIDQNRASHFDPVWDSLKIYFALFRFVLASLVTAAIGLLVFYLVYEASTSVIASETVSRIVGVLVNFYLAKTLVFHARGRILVTFVRYLALVVVLGVITYFMIIGLVDYFGMGVITAKVLTALLLYVANFAIQREFVFDLTKTASGLGSVASPSAQEAEA